jgi:glycosyltransferase involved in cell wall biosynthesis
MLENRARNIGIFVHPVVIRSEVGPVAMLRLISILKRVRPDILAFNTPKAVLIGNLASRFTEVAVRLIFRRVNFPLRRNIFTRLKYTWGVDCIVAISHSIKSELQTGGVPASKIRVIYEGIDLSPYSISDQRNARAPDEPAIVGTVAHLSREKGINYLVEAAALIPGVHRRFRFVIVGDGVCLSELQEQVRNKNLELCFQFAGFCPDPAQHLRSFDIFVLPSLSEGLGSAIIEAMANSLPIVGTRVGGIPELVTSGDNGLLVDPADPAALAQAIQQLADHPEVSSQMGRRGRKRVEEQFTLEKKIVDTENLCRRLLERRRSSRGIAHV